MGFISPWFLGGLLAVGIPLWVHLLRKHKSEPLKFSSLMFFEPRTQSSIKHRRLRYLLLMAARISLFVLLALAFANPFVMEKVTPGAGEKRLVAIVLDQSFSMRAGGRMEQAKREATALTANWNPAVQGVVMTIDSQLRQVNQATQSKDELRAAIQTVQAGDAKSSFGELARALRSQAETLKMPLEVHLFSDMQKSSMPASFADLRLAAGTSLVLHPVGTVAKNWVVESVTAPHHISDPKKMRVQATIAGYGTPMATPKVSIAVNGKVLQTKQATLAPNGRATVEFVALDAVYGVNHGQVTVEAGDGLPQDDSFYFGFERSDPQRVLFVHEARQSRGELYYRTALQSAADSPFVLEPVTVEQSAALAPEKFAFTILSDVATLPATFDASLRRYVRAGGSVLIAVGPAAAARATIPLIGAKVVQSKYATASGERFHFVSAGDATHPALLNTNRWENVRFYQSFQIEAPAARVLARLADQTPILMEQPVGEGRVLVFASTFDNLSNDFPLHPAFVPFVEQTARYLGGMEDTQSAFVVDSFLELRKSGSQGEALEVLGPDGKRALSVKDAASAKTLQLTQPGFFELRRANGRFDLVAVNVDRRESDLEVIPKESLDLWQGSPVGQTHDLQSVETTEKPKTFWWYLLLVLLAAAVFESLLAGRYLAVEKETA
jgi:hypothetical protein